MSDRLLKRTVSLTLPCPYCGKPGRVAVAGVEVRGRIVGREDDQRVQELNELELIAGRERGEGVTRRPGLAAVAQDHFPEVAAAPVVPVDTSSAARTEVHAGRRRENAVPAAHPTYVRRSHTRGGRQARGGGGLRRGRLFTFERQQNGREDRQHYPRADHRVRQHPVDGEREDYRDHGRDGVGQGADDDGLPVAEGVDEAERPGRVQTLYECGEVWAARPS